MRTEIININKRLEPHLNYNKKVEEMLEKAKKPKKKVKKIPAKGKVVASKTTKNKGGNVSQNVVINIGKKKSSSSKPSQPVRAQNAGALGKPQPQFNINPVINIPEIKLPDYMLTPPPSTTNRNVSSFGEIRDFSTFIPKTTTPIQENENIFTYTSPTLPISTPSHISRIQFDEGEITRPRSSQSIYIPNVTQVPLGQPISERTPETAIDGINTRQKRVKPIKETTPFDISISTQPIQPGMIQQPSFFNPNVNQPKQSQIQLTTIRRKPKKDIVPEMPFAPIPEFPITYTPILQEEESNIRTPVSLRLPVSDVKKKTGEKRTDFYSSTGGGVVKKPPTSRNLHLAVEPIEPMTIDTAEIPTSTSEEISIPKKSRKLIDKRGRPSYSTPSTIESEEEKKAKRREQYHKSKGRTLEEIRQIEKKKYGITTQPINDGYVPIEVARRETEAKSNFSDFPYKRPIEDKEQNEDNIPIPKNNKTLVKQPPISKKIDS